MPGGKFWFLPDWHKEKNRIELPVPQVLNWLLDLLDAPSCWTLRGAIGNKNLREKEGSDSVVRTLDNWLKGVIPKSAEKIEQIFPGDAVLNFAGAFLLGEGLPMEAQLHEALSFVSRKVSISVQI